jgi:hypothetical protein
VAVKRGPVSPVDSIQLQKNIAELMMKKAAEQEPDNVAPATPVAATLSNGDFEVGTETKDTVLAKPGVAKEKSTVPLQTTAAAANPQVVRTTGAQKQAKTPQPTSRPVQQQAAAKKPAADKPKAVMPQRVANEY